MSRFLNWLRSIPRPVAWIVIIGGILFLMGFAVVFSATAWEYTNSPQFCGETCHTMPPEYIAYQVSPHARVDCVDCHLGQDSFREAVPAKAREITHVTNALFQTYEPPIYVKNLRPARDTCEQCHNPDKFAFDTFAQFSRFASDELNSEDRYYMSFKTGGGKEEQGLGRGIHWHIDSEVYYFTDDPLKQTIPYVKTVAKDGTVTEYFDVEAGLPPDFGETNADKLARMDCIDCHNRISHNFRSPENAVDTALNNGTIDKTIPWIKSNGVRVLGAPYSSQEEGLQAIAALDTWYQNNEPEYYAENQETIAAAISGLQDVFSHTVFPNMEVGWQTHPNNVAHKEFPGCFRCHDGKHTSPEGETVRLECNICHTIPEVVKPGQQAPVISLAPPNEPESHKNSNWLAQHQYVFDDTCAECHDVSNPGGTDNTSFCSNSACHATEWTYVGLDAPAIRALAEPPRVPGTGQPNPIPHPAPASTDCTICHGPEGVRPFPESHASFDQSMCAQCHQASDGAAGATEATPAATEAAPAATEAAPAPAVGSGAGGPPAIPHPVQGRENCVQCHGENGIRPYPADHAGRPVDSCQMCHKPEAASAEPAAAPTAATATPAATAEPTAEPTAEATETRAPGIVSPPAIPHPIDSQSQCLTCHAIGSIKPFPANHESFTEEQCLTCHQPGS